MINKQTVFVLGAGASAPYGFPTGEGLRRLIIKRAPQMLGNLNQDKFNREGFVEYGKKFSQKFKDSSVNSIDRFLNEQVKNDIEMGKILIMAFIRESEKKSKFNEDMENDKLDWYRQFWNHLIKGVKNFDDLTFQNFRVITFNYDRSFEFFLYKSVRNLYPVSKVNDENIFNLMRSLNIMHVFGRVGNMVWDDPGKYSEESVQRTYYNQIFDFELLSRSIDSIKIIIQTENQNYKDIIENVEEVYFLGFGFLQENMEILGAPFQKKSSIKTRYLATALGSSKENIDRYYKKYFSHANSINNLIDCDCCALLRNHLE